jgi:hypothetical protein
VTVPSSGRAGLMPGGLVAAKCSSSLDFWILPDGGHWEGIDEYTVPPRSDPCEPGPSLAGLCSRPAGPARVTRTRAPLTSKEFLTPAQEWRRGGISGVRMGAGARTARPGRWAHPGLPSPGAESRAARLAAALLLPPLTDVEVRTVDGPSQRDSFPLTVSSPDLPEAGSRASSPATARTGSPARSGARRHRAPRNWSLRCSTQTRRAAPSPTGWSTGCLLASPACRRCQPTPQKGLTTSAGAATGARARRGALRITTTSWSYRWTPGWIWQPERPGRSWSHASAVTCSAAANWSRPARAASPVTCPQDTLVFTRASADVHRLFIFGVNLAK